MIYVLHGVIVIRLCRRAVKIGQFLQGTGGGGREGKVKTEGNERRSERSPGGLKCPS